MVVNLFKQTVNIFLKTYIENDTYIHSVYKLLNISFYLKLRLCHLRVLRPKQIRINGTTYLIGRILISDFINLAYCVTQLTS